MSESPQNKKYIAFVLYPGLTPLDLVGPLQVLNARGPEYFATVVGETIEPMETDTPLRLMPQMTFDDLLDPAIIVVPGGGIPTYRAMANTKIRDWLVNAASTAEVVASVCTGALILAAAGLLEGRQATTHWAHWKTLERLGAHYNKKRWVEDGKFITAAGVSAGIDMALYLTGRMAGVEMAKGTQLALEYDPEMPFGRIEWDKVDRNALDAELQSILPQVWADRPDLLARVQQP
jgi:transcriptional regulator GlxA family with amidase domain